MFRCQKCDAVSAPGEKLTYVGCDWHDPEHTMVKVEQRWCRACVEELHKPLVTSIGGHVVDEEHEEV